MNLFDCRPARNYCEWHEIATKGLCQDAKDRILAEIEAHYADGLREQLDAGKTGDNEAHRAAMAALGTVFLAFHFREHPANALTIAALDPIAKIPEFKACAVSVEKL